MAVQSTPAQGARQQIGAAAQTAPWRAMGLIALVLGFSLWLVGARFTVLGVPRVIELFFGLFRINVALALPGGWSLFGITIAVGLVMSLGEFGCHPRRAFFSKSLLFGLILFLIWLLINGGDLSSTFFGVTAVQPDSWPLTKWIATTSWAAATWTVFLTYGPELLMIAGVRWLIRGGF